MLLGEIIRRSQHDTESYVKMFFYCVYSVYIYVCR